MPGIVVIYGICENIAGVRSGHVHNLLNRYTRPHNGKGGRVVGLRVDKSLMGASGVVAEHGICHGKIIEIACDIGINIKGMAAGRNIREIP